MTSVSRFPDFIEPPISWGEWGLRLKSWMNEVVRALRKNEIKLISGQLDPTGNGFFPHGLPIQGFPMSVGDVAPSMVSAWVEGNSGEFVEGRNLAVDAQYVWVRMQDSNYAGRKVWIAFGYTLVE